MKKCPPGIICIENMTMVMILFIIIGIVYYMTKTQFVGSSSQPQTQSQNVIVRETPSYPSIAVRPNYGYTNLPGDVLMNPYAPPLRDERYMVPAMPINVSTNVGAVDTSYRQLGILTPLNRSGGDKNDILPLMGRPLFVSRDKWQYYTMSDQKNSMKLPISRNGRSCTTEYGVDKLFNGDTIYVEGYNKAFKVTTYDNDVIQYIPYL
jgi:hypothetical protein